MTDNDKFYLAMALMALEEVRDSDLPSLIHAVPERGFIYLFDTAFAMGFAGAKQMQTEGVDIQTIDPRKLSLVKDPYDDNANAPAQ